MVFYLFKKIYELSKMFTMLGLEIVRGRINGSQNLCIHVWTLPLPKLVHYTILLLANIHCLE
jgi:hypothetical protein